MPLAVAVVVCVPVVLATSVQLFDTQFVPSDVDSNVIVAVPVMLACTTTVVYLSTASAVPLPVAVAAFWNVIGVNLTSCAHPSAHGSKTANRNNPAYFHRVLIVPSSRLKPTLLQWSLSFVLH
jgi:hypothetical protein